MIAPRKYIQGSGAIREIGSHVAKLGQEIVILGSKSGLAACQADLESTLRAAGCEPHFLQFQGECSRAEIDRVGALVKTKGGTVVLAVGGGKCIDCGKAVAHEAQAACVVIPTIASTDAPCSALAVIYTPDHVFESYYILPKNPDMVVVDTAIIARAPARFLVAGMGDALATWFEAAACHKSAALNLPGGQSTEAALTLAHLCFQLLLRYGKQAKLDVETGIASSALAKIVEANTLLSGLGFESCGLAAAHGIHDGLTALAECHHLYHGEKVAFGTLALLVLEDREKAEIDEVLDFCTDVGLPITLAEMGITATGADLDARLLVAAAATCAPGGMIHNEPFAVSEAAVVAALKGADALGRNYFVQTGKQPTYFAASH